MPMRDAAKRYKSCRIRKEGKIYYPNNSSGKERGEFEGVAAGELVYHRSGCNFAVLDRSKDSGIISSYHDDPENIGGGDYRQLHDHISHQDYLDDPDRKANIGKKRRSERKGYKKKTTKKK